MANKLVMSFQTVFRSDGSSGSLIVNLSTGPIGYSPPGQSPALSDVNLALASDAIELGGDWTDAVVTKTALIAGILTLAIAPTPPQNELHTILGKLVF